MTAAAWFPGEARDQDDEAVLTRLRENAGRKGLADARPENSSAAVHDRFGLVACVRVPGLEEERGRPSLQACIDVRDPAKPVLTTAWETFGFLLDMCSFDDVDPTDLRPLARADLLFGWLEAQLRRPVERWEWRRRWRPPARLWRLADDGEPFEWNVGARLRYDRGRAPDAIVRLR